VLHHSKEKGIISIMMTQNKMEAARSTAPTCSTTGYQTASVCVPVTVIPFANVGEAITKCCGTPVVTMGKNSCEGPRNRTCVFTITQEICVEVPVEIGAVADTGEVNVACIAVSSEDICNGCESPELPVERI